jgi:hypothetical protein
MVRKMRDFIVEVKCEGRGNKCNEFYGEGGKVLGRFRWEIEEEKVVLVMGVLYLTLMLGSGVGVRKGGREGKRRHVTPSNTHVLKIGREKVYGHRGLAHSISRDCKGGVPRDAEVCSAGLI